MKRGRPKGPRGPNAGSWCDWLVTFEVGERRYIETTAADYATLQKNLLKPAYIRTHAVFEGRRYTCSMFTAVSAKRLSDVRYLLCVEREQ